MKNLFDYAHYIVLSFMDGATQVILMTETLHV